MPDVIYLARLRSSARPCAVFATASGPLLALLAASAFFATQTDKFLTGHNFSLIIQQVVVVGTLAIGQTSSS